MAVDAGAAQRFRNNPLDFLQKNYFYVRGQGLLNPVRKKKGGGDASRKILDGKRAEYDLNHPKVRIVNNDLVTVQGGGNRPFKAFVEFETTQEPNSYYAMATAERRGVEVYFCSASANQISCLELPASGGPDIVLTDPLSGCSVFVTDMGGGRRGIFHANALALKDEFTIQYMDDLFDAFVEGTSHQPLNRLDKNHYRRGLNLIEQWANEDKQALGRTSITTQQSSYTNVVGIRTSGVWTFYWQIACTVDSERTGFMGGVKNLFKGRNSHKYRIYLVELPAHPLA